MLQSLFGHLFAVVPAADFAVSLLLESNYSAQKLAYAWQDALGTNGSMLDSREAGKLTVLLGFCLTHTDDASTFIVADHNGSLGVQ